jgi:betaine lipid synthase
VDMQHLELTSEDSLLCITSAGDNALHCKYGGVLLTRFVAGPDLQLLPDAIDGPPGQQPKMISCVDMNPCQGHLLELKLASIRALDFENHWKVSGWCS